MISKKEIKKWLLENCVNENGDLDLSHLDFSDFEGNVFICEMKVKKNLGQYKQQVSGNLSQSAQDVKGDLFQSSQIVGGELLQDEGELSNLEILELLKKRLKLTVMGDIVFVPIVKEEIINGEKILIDLGTYKIKEWLEE